ncbi:MAG: exodeoxyribonuclease VII large subunit [Clostridiales bacterium]|nr:exodeoxyribonuclease VII large subunit [Clostridiales bacterium]
MNTKVFEVSELNVYIKLILDSDETLSAVYVRGEISNYKLYPSGHHYFTVKDKDGALRCVMFKGSASSLRFRPENGMKVIVFGRVSVFPRDGQYQMYCSSMTPDGVGDLYVAFEQLKEKLLREGLFDVSHKKPLPRYPERIALITSPAGAAVHDMIRVLKKRFPIAKVILLPVRVQGAEAPAEISAALKYANKHKVADIIITGRGGGSIEDLWAFNDESVARAVYESQIPVISAVGHEPDVTISDFAADLRAATPSNGAELAVPDITELRITLDQIASSIERSFMRQIELKREKLTALAGARSLTSPLAYIEARRTFAAALNDRLNGALKALLVKKRSATEILTASLDALSPLKVLSRGYGIAIRKDGLAIKSIKNIAVGDAFTLMLSDGTASCTVNELEEVINGS